MGLYKIDQSGPRIFQTKALPAAQFVFARRMVPLLTLRYINVIKRNLYKSSRMKKTASNSPWNPIATAPAHVELELCVHDGEEYHALAFPCRRNGVGWSDVRLNKMVPIRPTHWRLWGYERM